MQQNSNTKRFELSDIARIPVTMSEAARAAIHTSSDQGRKWPNALAELFGAQGNVIALTIDLVPMSAHFRVSAAEQDTPLLAIVAKHAAHPAVPDHRWFVSVASLCEVAHTPHLHGFQAHIAAQDLLQVYPHRHIPAPSSPPTSVVTTGTEGAGAAVGQPQEGMQE